MGTRRRRLTPWFKGTQGLQRLGSRGTQGLARPWAKRNARVVLDSRGTPGGIGVWSAGKVMLVQLATLGIVQPIWETGHSEWNEMEMIEIFLMEFFSCCESSTSDTRGRVVSLDGKRVLKNGGSSASAKLVSGHWTILIRWGGCACANGENYERCCGNVIFLLMQWSSSGRSMDILRYGDL